MDGGVERFPLVVGQNSRTRRVWQVSVDVRQPEQAPGNDAHQRQIRLEPLDTPQGVLQHWNEDVQPGANAELDQAKAGTVIGLAWRMRRPSRTAERLYRRQQAARAVFDLGFPA